MEMQAIPVIQEDNVDLKAMMRALKQKIKWIVISMVVCTVLAGSYAAVLFFGVFDEPVVVEEVIPTYKATASIYYLNTYIGLAGDMQYTLEAYVGGDFAYFGTSQPVLDEVVDRLGVDILYEDFVEFVTASQKSNTHVIIITVKHEDAEFAIEACNVISDVLREYIADATGGELPTQLKVADFSTLVEVAEEVVEEVEVNVVFYIVIGLLVGFILPTGVIVLRFLLDDTIHDAKDVQKYLQLETLASLNID